MQGLRPIPGDFRLGHHDNLPRKMEAPRQGRGSPGSDTHDLGGTRKTWEITVTLRTREGMGYPGNPVYMREHGSVPVILYAGEHEFLGNLVRKAQGAAPFDAVSRVTRLQPGSRAPPMGHRKGK